MSNLRILELETLIQKANDQYYSGESDISDEQYDAWKDELKDLCSQTGHPSKLLASVGASVDNSAWQKQQHLIPMSSLDKVNSEEQFVKWAAGKSKTGFSVQEKLDGLSLSIDIKDGKLISATTRGDGVVGENILRNVKKMQGIPAKVIMPDGKPFSGSIRGEIILTKSNWKQFFPKIANPRNGASGVSRRLDGEGAEHLTFIAYDLLTAEFKLNSETKKIKLIEAMGFKAPNHGLCATAEDVFNLRDKFINLRDTLDYDIDGLVIKIDDIDLQNKLGRAGGAATGNPNGQVAFKFANEMRETVIRQVLWDVGLTGRITPVADFEPVLLDGVKIEKASLYNASNVRNLQISRGAKVLVSRRNQVIPAVERVIRPSEHPVIIPTTCPVCQTNLQIEGEYLICMNDNCEAKVQGNIQKWVENVGIDNIGPQLIENMCRAGMVKTVADLYRLKVADLAKLDRMGDTSAAKVIKNINDKKQIPLHIFLGSLNIPNCGRRVFESLIEQGYDTLDYILSLLPAHFEQVDGVGEKTAQDIFFGLKARKELIEDLLKAGVTIGAFAEVANANVITTQAKVVQGQAKNKSFCFTGAMSLPRNVLEAYAKKAGGIVKNSVTAGLDYLVMADPASGTAKAKKARSLGTQTISEQDFMTLISK